MREKALELMNLTAGTFEQVIGGVDVDLGLGTVPASELPEPLQQMLTIVKEKLALDRATFETRVVAAYAKHLTEEDVDAIIAFNKSDVGRKIKAVNAALQADLVETVSKWRNEALDPHRAEIGRALGVVEPEPATDSAPAA